MGVRIVAVGLVVGLEVILVGTVVRVVVVMMGKFLLVVPWLGWELCVSLVFSILFLWGEQGVFVLVFEFCSLLVEGF